VKDSETFFNRKTRRLRKSIPGRLLSISDLIAKTGTRFALSKVFGTDSLHIQAAQQLVETFGSMKGLPMKLGQMLSYVDQTIPKEYRDLLSVLQTQSYREPYENIRRTIKKGLGKDPEELFRSFDPDPISCASIGQVHRAVTRDGVEVAVKVQYNGIEKAIRSDLRFAQMANHFVKLLFPQSDPKGASEELKARFLDECDYRKEARWQEEFAGIYRDDPLIVVPKVYAALSSRRVLTTTFQQGQSFQQFLDSRPSQQKRNVAGEAMERFYFSSLYTHGVFNCDPHPGNYVFLKNGQVAFLDYGCVRRYDEILLKRLLKLARVVLEDDLDKMHEATVAFGIVDKNSGYDRAAARRQLRYLYEPVLEKGDHPIPHSYTSKAFNEMFLDNKNVRTLRMPKEFIFLNRITFGLMSVFADLGCVLDWNRISLRRWAEAEKKLDN
jgi:predicted unusual protein kinase regulating ubiquinone biosynthesis (AarF/ABC1/UbiB family)